MTLCCVDSVSLVICYNFFFYKISHVDLNTTLSNIIFLMRQCLTVYNRISNLIERDRKVQIFKILKFYFSSNLNVVSQRVHLKCYWWTNNALFHSKKGHKFRNVAYLIVI